MRNAAGPRRCRILVVVSALGRQDVPQLSALLPDSVRAARSGEEGTAEWCVKKIVDGAFSPTVSGPSLTHCGPVCGRR